MSDLSERLLSRTATETLRDSLTEKVIGAAIEVHRLLGPGLLESAYEECLCWELRQAGLTVERQVPLPVEYKAINLEIGYRMDLVVNNQLVVELKTVEKLLPIHEAQLLTYLKLSGLKTGLLLNFNSAVLKTASREWCCERRMNHRDTEAQRTPEIGFQYQAVFSVSLCLCG